MPESRTSTAAPPSVRRPRSLPIDALRGIAIVLLLLLHATNGMTFRFGIQGPSWIEPFNAFFTPYRMPTLMFLSGMLLGPSLAKPLGAYYLNKLRNLAWPYLIWTTILLMTAGWSYFVVWYLPNPMSWIDVGYTWYLWFLLCFTFVAPLIRWIPSWLVAAACVVAAIALPLGTRPESYAYHAAFFFLGHAFMQHRHRLEPLLRRTSTLVVLIVFGLAAGCLSAGYSMAFAREGFMLPLTLAGILAVLLAFERIGDAPWLRAFAWVGERSIVFYLVHWPVLVLAGWLIARLSIDWLWLPGNLLAVLVVTIPLAAVARRRPWRWMFQAPFLGGWTRRLVQRSRARAASTPGSAELPEAVTSARLAR